MSLAMGWLLLLFAAIVFLAVGSVLSTAHVEAEAARIEAEAALVEAEAERLLAEAEVLEAQALREVARTSAQLAEQVVRDSRARDAWLIAAVCAVMVVVVVLVVMLLLSLLAARRRGMLPVSVREVSRAPERALPWREAGLRPSGAYALRAAERERTRSAHWR